VVGYLEEAGFETSRFIITMILSSPDYEQNLLFRNHPTSLDISFITEVSIQEGYLSKFRELNIYGPLATDLHGILTTIDNIFLKKLWMKMLK
jgi:hypothetical protein